MQDQPPLARRDSIAARLAQGQSVIAAALATEFGVSEDAVRRDLRALAAEGRCRRVYGGALPMIPGALPMATRMGEGLERKAALAKAAAGLIQPGEFIFIDNGSTNLAITGFLPDDLIVATNSIDIAVALMRRPGLQLIFVGGAVNPVVGGCVDAEAVQSILRMNIDRCILGACGLVPASGVSAFDMADMQFKRTLLAHSRSSIVLATNKKFETHAPYRVAALGEISQFVVESDAPASALKALKKSGAAVLKASLPG